MAAREYSAPIADAQGKQLPREDSRALLGFHSCLYRQQVISLRQIQLSGFSPVQVASPCKLRLYAVPDGEVEQSICCQALRIIRRSMRTCDDAPVPAHLQAHLQVRFLFTRSPATSDDWGGGEPSSCICQCKNCQGQTEVGWLLQYEVVRTVSTVLTPQAPNTTIAGPFLRASLTALNYISGSCFVRPLRFYSEAELPAIIHRAIYRACSDDIRPLGRLPHHDEGQPRIHVLCFASRASRMDTNHDAFCFSYDIKVWYILAFSG
jgi:hypothetical protein